jgi:hypothetical protein
MGTKTTSAALLTAAVLLIGASSASAFPYRGHFGMRGYVYAPFFPEGYWGPYPYSWTYPIHVGPEAHVRVQVTPKQTEVYVDGFYAGEAEDFDGVFKQLNTTPGGHEITLKLDGYRTITDNVYVSPDHTVKLHDTMEKLAE